MRSSRLAASHAIRPDSPAFPMAERLEDRRLLAAPILTLTTPDAQATESAVLDEARLQITRKGPLVRPLIASLSLSGPAKYGVDYTLWLGTKQLKTRELPRSATKANFHLTVPARRASVTLRLVPLKDNLVEPVEKVSFRLRASPAYTLDSRPSRRAAVISLIDAPVPPVVSLTAPAPNSNLWGDNLITGQITGGTAPLSATYWFDSFSSTPISLSLDSQGLFSQNIDLFGIANGPHTITVQVQDSAGRSAQASTPVQVDVHKVFGLDVGLYTQPGEAPGSTQLTEDQIRQRLSSIAPFTEWVRFYGATGGLEHAGRIAHELGLKVGHGAWLSKDTAANEREIQNLIAAIQAGHVDLAIVGSETLLRGDLTAPQLIAWIDQVRAAIPQGKNVSVATADTYSALIANPTVIAASDLFMPNVFPFWEHKSLQDAVVSLPAIHQTLTQSAQGKPIWYSEVGWPSAGSPLDAAVPSPGNAAFYFSNVQDFARANSIPIFYFQAIDEPWKSENSVGPHWGIFHDGALKPGMGDIFRGQTSQAWQGSLIDGPGEPAIQLTSIPPIGGTDNLRGRVTHVEPAKYKIGVYIKVGSGWWTKPTFAQPDTSIGADGSWQADITTGGSDAQATDIAVFLVPIDYTLPPSSGRPDLPPELTDNAVASILHHRS